MTQDRKAQGREGWLAPAQVECHSISGGKPPFPTLSFSIFTVSIWIWASQLPGVPPLQPQKKLLPCRPFSSQLELQPSHTFLPHEIAIAGRLGRLRSFRYPCCAGV